MQQSPEPVQVSLALLQHVPEGDPVFDEQLKAPQQRAPELVQLMPALMHMVPIIWHWPPWHTSPAPQSVFEVQGPPMV